MSGPVTILMDNGSLEPAATLALRALAAKLAKRIGTEVAPVSLLHSSGVPAEKLGGTAAEILEPALECRLQAGQMDFLVVPLFFGPSGALTEYLPGRIARLRAKYPQLSFRLADPLSVADDDRVAQILADHVRALASQSRRVALVDHGSPVRAVMEVRDRVARQLGGLLGAQYVVAASSMERREGAAYDFGEPLLASLLRQPGWSSEEVIVAMQFLLPGRHAGPGGDVAKICREAEAASRGTLRTTMTDLVGKHPLLIEILADRWRKLVA
ncbi:MAG TPA: CbiX/SirB N-terminal domain-containing protein [Lacunisphaera sp.]|nr:CbiX/SirB N-terminal domain-containing protein [Lacunisphaera sp.]